nr:hypothetical protein [Streptomyces sp. NRRL B-24720]
MRAASLDHHEQRYQQGAQGQAGDDHGIGPTALTDLRQSEQQASEADQHEQIARRVDAALARPAAHLAQRDRTPGQTPQPDRHVVPEHPLPAEAVRQKAAQGRSHKLGDGERSDVDTHAAPQMTLRERVGEQGRTVGQQHRTAGGLYRTQADQVPHAGREAQQQAGAGVGGQAEQIHGAPPEHVRQPAERHHQAGIGQHERQQDPVRSGGARIEMSHHLR